MMKHLNRYLNKEDVHDFAEKLLHKCCRRNVEKCIDVINCYLGLKDHKAQKLPFYFSVDISKFICGYKTQGLPSEFPCLNSYISSGIPKQILARTNVTGVSFVIQDQVPYLKTESGRIIEKYFVLLDIQNEDGAGEIQLDLLKHDDE